MKNPTELMREILQNDISQRIIDYVSPIYGDSYVALWIYEAIGRVLKMDVVDIAEALKKEGNPATSELLLDQWEDYYKLPRDPKLSTAQRQARIIAWIRQRGPCNPTNLALLVSAALGGVEVDITENVARNTFMVNIREMVDSLLPAINALDRRKPAHLIYWLHIGLQTEASTEVKIAVASTCGETEAYIVEVEQYSERYDAHSMMNTAVAITSADIFSLEVEQ